MVISYLADPDVALYHGDALAVLREIPDASVDCIVTSPPYWGLRDYDVEGQIGLEASPSEYVAALVDVFAEARRALVSTGTLWLNLGDTYASKARGSDAGWAKSRLTNPARVQKRQRASLREVVGERHRRRGAGLKEKDLVGIPWRVAFALQADGWWLRSDIIWSKPNVMPASVKDRPTSAHEYVFLLAKSKRYHFDQDAVREPYHYDGRNVLTREAGEGSHENHRNGKRNRWPGISAAAAAAARREVRESGHDESEPMAINHGGRNVRSVWTIPTQPYPDAHFAVMAPALAERCILAGCPEGGVVLDPFAGAGTTLLVARRLARRGIGVEISETFCALAAERLSQQSIFAEASA